METTGTVRETGSSGNRSSSGRHSSLIRRVSLRGDRPYRPLTAYLRGQRIRKSTCHDLTQDSRRAEESSDLPRFGETDVVPDTIRTLMIEKEKKGKEGVKTKDPSGRFL